jgi:hypothetical protein
LIVKSDSGKQTLNEIKKDKEVRIELGLATVPGRACMLNLHSIRSLIYLLVFNIGRVE